MKKENFILLILFVIGGLFFSLGMCMCLVSEWNLFNFGIIFSAIGFIVTILAFLYYRKLSGKGTIKINFKILLKTLYGIIALIVFGAGIAMVLAYEMFILGIIVGIIGVIMLLGIIPIWIGLK